MADDVVEQIRPHIHEVSRIALEEQGMTLHELNKLMERTVSSYRPMAAEDSGTPPIRIEFRQLRRSTRGDAGKRSYDKMDGATVTKYKRSKQLIRDYKAPAFVPGGQAGSCLVLTSCNKSSLDESISPPVESCASPTTSTSLESANKMCSEIAQMTHGDGIAILESYFRDSTTEHESTAVTDSHDKHLLGSENHALMLPRSTHISADLVQTIDNVYSNSSAASATGLESSSGILELISGDIGSVRILASDEPSEMRDGHDKSPKEMQHVKPAEHSALIGAKLWLADVLAAIAKMDDHSYQRKLHNQSLGAVHEAVTKSDFEQCVKIMTSIVYNWVRCTHFMIRSEQCTNLDTVGDKIRLGDYEHSSVSIHTSCVETTSQRHTRKLLEIETERLMSNPDELTGEFVHDGDFEAVIQRLERDHANDVRWRLRRLWKETYYWPMIQQRAKVMGAMPNAPGRKTDITPQEKFVAQQLVLALGYGQSRDNIFKWTAHWKFLCEARNKGALAMLLYRTREFKAYFFQHTRRLDMLLSWNEVYMLPLQQLEARIIARDVNDFSGKSDIEEKWISERLHAPPTMWWGDHLSVWDHESMEYEDFSRENQIPPTSTESNAYILAHGIQCQFHRNRSNFITLVPYEGRSEKRMLGKCSGSNKPLAVAPLVPILPGDFLGIFPGRLRYTDLRPPRSIPGPVAKLWLEYSIIMGKLSRIRVGKAGEESNVCLSWEAVNEDRGAVLHSQYLRVVVTATRHIMPFDELVRPSTICP